MKRIYSIAGLIVEITGEQTLQWMADLPGFNVFEIKDQNDTDIDIRIYADENIDTTDFAGIYQIHYTEVLGVKYTFSICKNGYLYEMYKEDGDKIVSIIYNSQTNNVFVSSFGSELYIKYAMWVAYSLPAIEKKVLPIHASTIVKDSEAILFLGESGTGKSTHTKLWMKYIENSYLLNDDSPLLRIENDEIFVYGSPWSGKTHCYQQKMVPLKAIVRLSQYPDNIISNSNKLASIGAIQPSFPPFLAYDKLLSEKVIHIMDKIINSIPIYGLKCRPDKQAAEAAYTEIY